MGKSSRKQSFRTLPVEQAVGTTLAHDMTQVIPGKYKGPAFKKGHKITSGDLCRLMQMGKNNLYVLDLKTDQVHEDDAVMALAGTAGRLSRTVPGEHFGPGIVQYASGCHVRLHPQPDRCHQRPEPGSHPGHPPGNHPCRPGPGRVPTWTRPFPWQRRIFPFSV